MAVTYSAEEQRPRLSLGFPGSDSRYRWVASLFAIVSALVLSGAFRTFITPQGGREEGNAVQQLILLALGGLSVALALADGIRVRDLRSLGRMGTLLLLIALTILSSLWSAAPPDTFKRSLALVISTLPMVYIALRLRPTDLVRALYLSAWIFAVVGFLAVAAGPGIERAGPWVGAWKGLAGGKNEFGRIVGMFLLMITTLWACRVARPSRSSIALVLVLLVELFFSRSQTPLMGWLVALAGTPICLFLLDGRLGHKRVTAGPRLIVAGLFGAVVAIATGIVPYVVTEVLGKDMTFSGRVNIWRYAMQNIGDDWTLGSGYRAFWQGRVVERYFEFFTWKNNGLSAGAPEHAHSAYMDMLLELGIVGCVVGIVFLLAQILIARRCLVQGQRTLAALIISTLIFSLILAVTERVFLQYGDIVWQFMCLFFCAAAVATTRDAWPQRDGAAGA